MSWRPAVVGLPGVVGSVMIPPAVTPSIAPISFTISFALINGLAFFQLPNWLVPPPSTSSLPAASVAVVGSSLFPHQFVADALFPPAAGVPSLSPVKPSPWVSLSAAHAMPLRHGAIAAPSLHLFNKLLPSLPLLLTSALLPVTTFSHWWVSSDAPSGDRVAGLGHWLKLFAGATLDTELGLLVKLPWTFFGYDSISCARGARGLESGIARDSISTAPDGKGGTAAFGRDSIIVIGPLSFSR